MLRPYRPRALTFRCAEHRAQRSFFSWLAALSLCTGLIACGGGGDGGGSNGGSNGNPPALGIVKVTVSDSFGAPVAGATVSGPLGSTGTDAQGVTLVALNPPGSTATLTVARESFVDQAVAATSAAGRVNEFAVTLVRQTAPAGASLASRSGSPPSIAAGGQQLSFEIELVVVDGAGRPIDNLAAADFALRECVPDAGNGRVDCVRGNASDADQRYAATTATPASLSVVAGGATRPYAAALLLDQSGSIMTSDPTGARLYSAKAFLAGMGSDDRALLAAFAASPGALLPSVPLSTYAPFRDAAGAGSYFATLDALQPLVGGGTPLYASLDALRQQVVAEPAVAGLAKSVVVFTDGSDNTCGDAAACSARRALSVQAANADGVRLFTIGLSAGVDALALGELASQTGGAFLYADSAQQLLPLYGSLGRLLSLSLPTYRLRWTVLAGAPNAFRSGGTLLGKVQVTQGSRSFDIPFLVGIP
jgi:hypothetical protein